MAQTKSTKKKVNYKPQVTKLIKASAATIARDVEVIQKKDIQRKVMRMVVKGRSYETISSRLGISTTEAYNLAKAGVQKWIREESLDTIEVREVMLRQIDATLALAINQTFPHPLIDEFGQPVMVKNTTVCFCTNDEGEPLLCCDKPDHMIQGTSQPDRAWAAMVTDLIDRKSKMLGTDAAQKLEEKKVDILQRVYSGVDAKVIENL